MMIRPEHIADYPAIASLNARAFDGRLGEGLIVAMQRQRHAFDPELSLVAELDGQVVGHALFNPTTVRLLDMPVRAVNLAPIAVLPGYQGRGIGAALIGEGHRIAREKGFSFSYLLGHTDYYPRFGYIPGMFGGASLSVDAAALAVPAETRARTQSRDVTQDDLPALMRLWHREEDAVDFAIEPEPTLVDWLSPHPAIRAQVIFDESGVLGYTRVHAERPLAPAIFLARDASAALLMAAYLAPDGGELTLPLHARSASAVAFGQSTCDAWDPAMAIALHADSPLHEYHVLLQSGQRQPGRPLWPTVFDID